MEKLKKKMIDNIFSFILPPNKFFNPLINKKENFRVSISLLQKSPFHSYYSTKIFKNNTLALTFVSKDYFLDLLCRK